MNELAAGLVSVPGPADESTVDADIAGKLGDLAAGAGIRRVHVLAWRDLDDVEAGGSEVHAHEVLRRWAAAGLEVTLRTSYAQGQPPVVTRDGYRVIRRAGRYLVFPRAVGSEVAGRHGPSDAVVEIWNGVPFFSPLWAGRPRLVLLHHVHAEMWRMVLGGETPLLASAGEALERRLAPRAYRRTRVVTLCESSRQEIVEMLGLRPGMVDVVAPGIDARFSPGATRDPQPTVVAVGRLVPVKRYDLLISAAAVARRTVPALRIVIVGEGYQRPALDAVVRELGAEDWVSFAGHLRDAELVALYRRAWVVASASAREGWGMSLTEAAACATPAVATRIAGHVDAVVDGRSGLLTDEGPDALGAALARVLGDGQLRQRLSDGALARASALTWDATATGVLGALVADARRRPTSPRAR
ncbi:MAG: glycosyltransferase family 4 protein [Acidimicrobiales bacterium]